MSFCIILSLLHLGDFVVFTFFPFVIASSMRTFTKLLLYSFIAQKLPDIQKATDGIPT